MRDRSKDTASRASPEEPAAGAWPSEGAEPEERALEGEEPEADGGEASRLQEVVDEMETLRDRYLRTVAEYDNFRRRTERERAEGVARAQSQIVQNLLEPLDDLQRVAHFGSDAMTVESLLEGVRLVERKLWRALETAGLEAVAPHAEPFDPTLHEALMTSPAEREEDDDTVGEVFQLGYQFKGILLRPARVQVKKYGE